MSATLPSAAGVDVWEVGLDRTDDQFAEDLEALNEGERSRAERYRAEQARRRFVTTRAVLRRLLGEYTGIAPAAIRIETGSSGKPYCPSLELHFNLTHAHEKAVFAFARKPVGVDLEWLDRPVPDAENLARRFFAPPEQEALQRVAVENRQNWFLRCWTLKEALLKARGSGLTQSLNTFAVDFTRNPPAFSWIAPPPDCEPVWSLRWLSVSGDYVGALAAQDPVHELRLRVYRR